MSYIFTGKNINIKSIKYYGSSELDVLTVNIELGTENCDHVN